MHNKLKHRIEMSNYDGKCRRVIKEKEGVQPFGILFWNGYILWTTKRTVYRTVIRTGATSTFKTLTYNAYDVDYFGDAKECM